MASCGTCGREIIWATIDSGGTIALDKATALKGEGRYALEFPEGGGRPMAAPLPGDREFRAHTAHGQTCGKPYGGF